MPIFYLTSTSPDGKRETSAVQADSLVEARQSLVDQGCTDIVVHTDDVYAIHQVEIPDNPFSPDEMVRLGSMSTWSYFLLMIWKLYRVSGSTCLTGALLLALGVATKGIWAIVVGSILLLFPLFLAAQSAFGNTSKRRYDALVSAAAWYRWDDVERLLSQQGVGVPPEERAYRMAQIMAGRGDVPGAVELYKSLTAPLEIPEWFSRIRQAIFYLIGNKADWARQAQQGAKAPFQSPWLDQAFKAYEDSVRLAADQAVPRIDLAKSLMKYRRDVRRARQLLEEAEELPAAEIAIAFMAYVRGIIALEERKPEEAIELIHEMQAVFSQIANGDAESGIDESRSFLVLANSLAGQEQQALAQFRVCEPRLVATNELEMLARCRQALGIAEKSD